MQEVRKVEFDVWIPRVILYTCAITCVSVAVCVLSLCTNEFGVLKRMELMCCLWMPQNPAGAPPAPGERVELRRREWPLSCHQPHPRSVPGRAAWNSTCGTQEAPQIQVRASFLLATADHILTGDVTNRVEQNSFWGVTVKLRKNKNAGNLISLPTSPFTSP